jgi:hypothetical protein
MPSVIIVTERFKALAKAVRSGLGRPNLPTVFMHLNPEFYKPGEIDRTIDAIVEEFVQLISPGIART